MGKSHKKAMNMQSSKEHKIPFPKFSFSSPINVFSRIGDFGRVAKIVLAAAFLIIAVCICCYPSAKMYYTQARTTERLAAELSAVNSRNSQVEQNVNALNTDEGIEASAHEEFGYVKKGEGSAIVSGIESESSSKMVQYVDSKSITAPDKWYSPILDFVFGYDNSPKS